MAVNAENVRVIILAAGFGSRLAPLTNNCPKCMVPLLGKTILDRQVKVLRDCGIVDIAIVAGHGAAAVPVDAGYKIFKNNECATTNMVCSLMFARDWILEGGDILISYGDIVYTKDVLSELLSGNADISVCIDKGWRSYWQERMDDPLSDAETMRFGTDGQIIELGRKPFSYDEIEGQYIGLQLWRASKIQEIMALYDSLDRAALYDGRPFKQMFMTSFIQKMIDSGLQVMPSIINHGWLEIDTLDDLKMCDRLHEEGKLEALYHDI